MFWSMHIFSVGVLVIIVGGIAYRLGKQEGIRITKNYYKDLLGDKKE